MTLWEVDIYPAEGEIDRAGQDVAADAADLALAANLQVTAGRGYLIQGDLQAADVDRLARDLLADPIVETTVVAKNDEGGSCFSSPLTITVRAR